MKTAFSENVPSLWVLAAVVLVGGWLARPVQAQDATLPTSDSATIPAGILPGSPLAQVVKLAKAGVDEGLIQAYVTNSTSTFNLDSDKLIYLKDTGVPNDLVAEMMERDTYLQSQMATVSAPPPTPYPTDTANPPPLVAMAPPDSSVPPDSTAPPLPPDAGNYGYPPDDGTEPPAGPVSLNDFYNSLSPYGNWVVVDGYGRCWLPGVGNYNLGWQPYGDHGHWAYTDSGWYWDSDYAWGWAPFHYGRWFHHDRLGWCWSPDTVWGPSWVTWRYSDSYCGWAPMPPGAYYQEGIGYLYNGMEVGANFDFGLSPDFFVFVGLHDFADPHPFRHRLDRGLATQAYRQTAPVNGLRHEANGFVNRGIDPVRVSQIAHTTIPTVSLRTTAGGSARALPSEPAFRAGGGGYGSHPQGGQYRQPGQYVRTPNGGYYAPPTAPRNYGQPYVQRPYTPTVSPPHQEPRPEPARMPEARPEERPPEAAAQPAPTRNYAPQPAPSRSSNTQAEQRAGPR